MKPDELLQEQNITSTPEQAADAATTETIEQNSIEEETPQVQTEDAYTMMDGNQSSRPATRQEIIERLKAIAESEDALNSRQEVESLKVQFYRMRTAEIEAAHKAFIAEKEAEYNKLFANPYQAAKYGYIDDVIEPRNTRFRVIRALAQLEGKRQGLPQKKHGNIPL